MKIKRRTQVMVAVLAFILVCTTKLVWLLLPAPWQYADYHHLVRLYMDVMALPVDSEDIGGDKTVITIDVDEHVINTHLRNTWLIPDQTKYENDPVLKTFIPSMSLKERENLLITFEIFVRVCERANLTYFLFSGSLLGAYRHQGLIPWDDDLDLVMNVSDWRKIRNVLSRVEGYVLFTPSDSHWKFYKKGFRPVPGKPFLWPFVDIFFFTEDSTHVWALSGAIKGELVNPKYEIFPLRSIPFENVHVLVPCEMETLVYRLFGMVYCLSPIFLHKYSEVISYSVAKNIPCSQLYNMFPFVFRQKDPNSGIIFETLKRGDKILRNVSVPQSC